jgi:hypothetical protein
MRRPPRASMSDPKPPCLQELVAAFGRYDMITHAAWQEYDRAIAQWRIDRLTAMGLRPISPEEMKERRRVKRASQNHAQPPGAGRAMGNASAPDVEPNQVIEPGIQTPGET